MIKNESKIITRCLDSCFDFCDAFSITDTGSTDDTLEVVKNYFDSKAEKKPYRIDHTSFKNFGFTRTESFTFAKKFAIDLAYDLP